MRWVTAVGVNFHEAFLNIDTVRKVIMSIEENNNSNKYNLFLT